MARRADAVADDRSRPAAAGQAGGRLAAATGAPAGVGRPRRPPPGSAAQGRAATSDETTAWAAMGSRPVGTKIGHAGGGAAQSVGRRRPFGRGQGQDVDEGARIPTEVAGAVEPGSVAVPPLSQTDHLPPVVGHHLAGPHTPEAHRRRPPGAHHVPTTVSRDPGEPQTAERGHPAVPQPVEGTADVIPPQRIAGRHPDVDPRRILRGHQHGSPARSPPGHLDPGRRRPASVDHVL